MPATTPSGWRSVQLSMPVLTWSVKSPLSNCGMPHANSTTSMPRDTSPCASVNTLPCSAVMACASASRCRFSSSRNLNITRARRMGGVSAQAGKAPSAAATAAFTSSTPPSATLPVTAPVAGLNTSCERGALIGATLPPIQCPMVVGEAEQGDCMATTVQRGEESEFKVCSSRGDGAVLIT